MQRKHTVEWRSAACVCLGVLLAGSAAAQSEPQGDVYTISRSVIANGGGIASGDCYVIVATIGEPVVGIVANGEFTLSSGFLSEIAVGGDLLFRTGFELKSGECKP